MSDVTITIKAIDLSSDVVARVRESVKGLGDQSTTTTQQGSALGRLMDELAPKTTNAGTAFTSLKGTLTGLWENPTAGAQKLTSALVTDLTPGLGSAGVAAGVTAAALLVVGMAAFALAERAAAAGGRLQDMSEMTGMSVPGLSRLSNAADVAGGSLERVGNAMFLFEKNVGEKADKVDGGLRKIGLSLEEIQKLDPDEQFRAIAAAIKSTEDPIARNSAGFEIFGRQFREMVPFIMKMNEALEQTADIRPWTDEEAREAERFEMQLASLKVHVEALAISLGRDLIPTVSVLVGGLVDASTWLAIVTGNVTGIIPKARLVGEAWSFAAAGLELFRGKAAEIPKVTGDATHGVDAWRASLDPLAQSHKMVADTMRFEKSITTELNAEYQRTHAENLTRQREAEAAAKKYADAWAELNSTGTDYAAVLDSINPKTLASVQYYLAAGRSIEQIAAAFPELTKAQVAAVGSTQKAAGELVTLWGQVAAAWISGDQESLQFHLQTLDAKQRADEDHAAQTFKNSDQLGEAMVGIQSKYDGLRNQEVEKAAKTDAATLAKYWADATQAWAASDQVGLTAHLMMLDAKQQHEEDDARQSIEDERTREEALLAIQTKYDGLRYQESTRAARARADELANIDREYAQTISGLLGNNVQAQLAANRATLNDHLLRLRERYGHDEEMLGKEVALYQEKARAIVLTNDPVWQAWKALNQDMRGEWASTWEQALNGEISWKDAALKPFDDLTTGIKKILAALLADLEAQFLSPLLNLLHQGIGSLLSAIPGFGGAGAGGGVSGATGLASSMFGAQRPGQTISAVGLGASGMAATGLASGVFSGFVPGAVDSLGNEASLGSTQFGGFMGLPKGGTGLTGQAGGGTAAALGGALAGLAIASQGGRGVVGAAESIGGSALMGASIGSIVPGIGTAIGAGIGAAVGGIKALLNNMGPSPQEKEGRTVEADFEKQFGGFQGMMIAVGKAYEATGRSAAMAQADVKALMDAEKLGGEATKAAIDKINAAFADEQRHAADVQSGVDGILAAAKITGSQFPAAMKPMLDELLKLPGLTDAEKTSLLGLTGAVKPNFADLTSMAKGYGLSLEDLGPAFEQANISGRADTIAKNFQDLVDAGADGDRVLHGMAGGINALVNDALKYGSTLPTALQPLVKQLFITGQLTDEAGHKLDTLSGLNFNDENDPLAMGMSSLAKAMADLVKILSPEGLPATAESAAGAIGRAFAGIKSPDIGINVRWNVPDLPRAGDEASAAAMGGRITTSGVQYLAEGGSLLRMMVPRGIDTVPFMGAVGEGIVTREGMSLLGDAGLALLNRGVDPSWATTDQGFNESGFAGAGVPLAGWTESPPRRFNTQPVARAGDSVVQVTIPAPVFNIHLTVNGQAVPANIVAAIEQSVERTIYPKLLDLWRKSGSARKETQLLVGSR